MVFVSQWLSKAVAVENVADADKYCHQTAQKTVGLDIRRKAKPSGENDGGCVPQFSTNSDKGEIQGGLTLTPAS